MRNFLRAALALLPLFASAPAFAVPPSVTPPLPVETSKADTRAYNYVLRTLSRLANAADHDNLRINSWMTVPAWAATTLYYNGDRVSQTSGSYTLYYEENGPGVSCTSGSSGGPTGTSSGQTDGGCNWNYIGEKLTATATADAANAPTILMGGYWATSRAYVAGETVVTFSGSGSAAMANFYTEQASSCTSASSGSGPSGTSNGQTDGGCTWNYVTNINSPQYSFQKGAHSYLWNPSGGGAAQTVIKYWNGVPTTSGISYENTYSKSTLSGFGAAGMSRLEFVTTSARFAWRTYEAAVPFGGWRVAVCNLGGNDCHYVSPTAFHLPIGNSAVTIIDFTNAGGAQPRDVIMESWNGLTGFGGIDVAATEDVWQPGGRPALTMSITSDSYGSAAGVQTDALSWFAIAADMLGVRNAINTSQSGCGYLIPCGTSNGTGTAIQRIADITTNNGGCPDILIDANGTNDLLNGQTSAAVVAAQATYLAAIRSACGSAMPIFVMGVWPHNNSGSTLTTLQAGETAMQAGVAALNDPLIWFIPVANDPQGAWQTGTGQIGSPCGCGNTDIFEDSGNGGSGGGGHLSAAGNRMFAARFVAAVRQDLAAAGY